MVNIEVEPGDDTNLVLQCRIRGSGAPARYSSLDALSCELWGPGNAAPMATGLPVAWFLAPDPATEVPTQTGYEQGQVVALLTAALLGVLMPSGRHYVKVFRVIAGSGGRRERIATARLSVRSPAPR